MFNPAIDIFANNIPCPQLCRPSIKQVKKPFEKISTVNLSQFRHEPQTQYIGQNLFIRAKYIVSMAEYSKAREYTSAKFVANKENLKENKHKGVLSEKAVKEIRNCVNWLVASAKLKTLYHAESKKYYSFKVNFITLTLPDTYDEITDVILKKDLLNPLLTTLRKGYGLKNYLWKLEFQQNGKLHVHLTTDTFIYWKDLRRLWNKRLVSCGHMAKFRDEHGHTDPNSTDVHAVYKINDIAAYISKYMSKADEQLAKVKGRIWQCNQELQRNAKPRIFVPASDIKEVMHTLFKPEIRYDAIKTTPDAFGSQKQIGEMFFIKPINWLMHIKGQIKEVYTQTCQNIRQVLNPIGFNSVDFSPA